ncbi:hypothetical protein PR048_013766 [Dryococelus australis]|uniref:Uncharacterized protein n=1 Tax=Dryococelus australis TaxID=614101 RepID=A0ABQ9HT33_9NEOP|nr:hypothetical protein PR048_013766 [Dryococelus australis]
MGNLALHDGQPCLIDSQDSICGKCKRVLQFSQSAPIPRKLIANTKACVLIATTMEPRPASSLTGFRQCRFCDRANRLLASHHGELGLIPGRVTPGFSQGGIVADDTAGRLVFSGISHFPAIAFRCCSIHASFHLHRLSRPRSGKSSSCRGRVGVVIRLRAFHIGELGSNPLRGCSQIFACGDRPGRSHWSADFLGDLPFSPALAFRCYSILTHSQDFYSPREEGLRKESAIAFVRDPIPAFAWSDFGKPLKTEIRMAGPGFEPGSSRMRVQSRLKIKGVVTDIQHGGQYGRRRTRMTEHEQLRCSAPLSHWPITFIIILLSLTLNTENDHETSTKRSKLDIEGETGGEDDHEDSIDHNDYDDSVDEGDDDFLDAMAHPSKTFAATIYTKKTENSENTGYFPKTRMNLLIVVLIVLHVVLIAVLIVVLIAVHVVLVVVCVVLIVVHVVLIVVLIDRNIAKSTDSESPLSRADECRARPSRSEDRQPPPQPQKHSSQRLRHSCWVAEYRFRLGKSATRQPRLTKPRAANKWLRAVHGLERCLKFPARCTDKALEHGPNRTHPWIAGNTTLWELEEFGGNSRRTRDSPSRKTRPRNQRRTLAGICREHSLFHYPKYSCEESSVGDKVYLFFCAPPTRTLLSKVRPQTLEKNTIRRSPPPGSGHIEAGDNSKYSQYPVASTSKVLLNLPAVLPLLFSFCLGLRRSHSNRISGLSPLSLKERALNTKQAGIAAVREWVGMAITLGHVYLPKCSVVKATLRRAMRGGGAFGQHVKGTWALEVELPSMFLRGQSDYPHSNIDSSDFRQGPSASRRGRKKSGQRSNGTYSSFALLRRHQDLHIAVTDRVATPPPSCKIPHGLGEQRSVGHPGATSCGGESAGPRVKSDAIASKFR